MVFMTPNNIFERSVLSNGIRVVTEHIPYLRSVSVGFWVMAGSRDEMLSENGITHLIEHLVFKGTKKRSMEDIARSLESVGGHLDAFTGKEVTCFNAHILDEHLELAVDVLSDLLLNPTFPENEFEKEKEVIIKELHHTLETPDELIFDYFLKDIYPSHPLGFQIAGTPESVQSIGPEQLRPFMEKHFTADRIIVSAAGNVDHKQLLALLEKYVTNAPTRSKRTLFQPTWPASSRNEYHSPGSQAHICLGAPGYKYADNRKFALLLLNTFLGSGMSSKLFQVVREKYGLAYSIFTFPDFFLDAGLFGIYVATIKEKTDLVLDILLAELKRLVDKPFKADELERLKSQLKGNLMLSLENATSRMGRLANMEIYLQDYFSLDEVLQSIEATTKDEIRNVAEELFADEQFVYTILTPTE